MKPLILINFKLYPKAIGKKGIKLARELSAVRSKRYRIAIAPSLLNLKELCHRTNLAVYAPDADPVTTGAHTGHISLKELKEMGAEGVLLNHSERKKPFSQLRETIKLCRELHLKTIVCASGGWEVRKLSGLNPDYLAYEPGKLIGGKVSVASLKPKIILKVARLLKKKNSQAKLLVGAGVHSREDLRKAVALGAAGALVGHAVPQAREPSSFLKRMLE